MPGKADGRLGELRMACGACRACPLHGQRRRAVFGIGSRLAELMFVGEAPGREEDGRGEPFIGKAGKLLDKMIAAMGLRREDVYITNVVKCRPPDNRTPMDFEVDACTSRFLVEEIKAIRPRVIVALGATAAQALLQTEEGIGRLRGRFHRVEYFKVMPTYHPAYLLRNPESKGEAWKDLKMVMSELDLGRKA